MQNSASIQRLLSIFAFVALTALSVVVFMGKSYENSLQALDSTTHAMLAMEVTANGAKPVLPMHNFVTNEKTDPHFNDHPFTLFYLSGQVMRFFGPEAWTARLVPGLFSVGCVLLTAWLGALLYSSAAVGLVAGLILMLSRNFILIGSRFHLDTSMIFFILLSFIAFRKKRPILVGVFAGMALWMKSPVAFLIFPSAFFALLMSGEMNKKEFKNLIVGGLVALFVGSWVWLVTGLVGGWNWVVDYWSRQVWGTAVGGRGSAGNSDFWFGYHDLKRAYLPWLYLLVVSLALILFRKRWKKPEVALTLAAALIVEIVISSMRFKFYWYYLPIFPFLALLCVDPLRDWLSRKWAGVMTFVIAAGFFVPTLLVATPIELGPENFPALRRFNPIIQHYGDCNDQVMYIDGGQPFGSFLDSIYEISFYTNRKILQAHCSDAQSMADSQNPAWIFVTGKNIECLSAETRKKYPVQYRFGRQHLLSRIIPEKEALNLTPLASELKPPRGCTPVAYPNNIYFPTEEK